MAVARASSSCASTAPASLRRELKKCSSLMKFRRKFAHIFNRWKTKCRFAEFDAKMARGCKHSNLKFPKSKKLVITHFIVNSLFNLRGLACNRPSDLSWRSPRRQPTLPLFSSRRQEVSKRGAGFLREFTNFRTLDALADRSRRVIQTRHHTTRVLLCSLSERECYCELQNVPKHNS